MEKGGITIERENRRSHTGEWENGRNFLWVHDRDRAVSSLTEYGFGVRPFVYGQGPAEGGPRRHTLPVLRFPRVITSEPFIFPTNFEGLLPFFRSLV